MGLLVWLKICIRYVGHSHGRVKATVFESHGLGEMSN